MNRGIARRPTCEGRPDAEAFLEALGDVARGAWLEFHAYAIMTNHFHLLVRSPAAGLSEGMRRLESAYVRGFNRVRGRDGALFRGRFTSRTVTSESHWYAVLRYIDRNPVDAGIVERAWDFPYGSAWWYARQSGPGWLVRSVVEGAVRVFAGTPAYVPGCYAAFTTAGDADWGRHVVEGRLARRTGDEDPLDDLVTSTGAGVRAWLVARARLADGTAPGLVLAGPEGLLRTVDSLVPAGSPAWERLRVGLLRTACGMTLQEIAAKLGRPRIRICRRWDAHRRAIDSDASYADTAANVLGRALRGVLGDGPAPGRLAMRRVSDTA